MKVTTVEISLEQGMRSLRTNRKGLILALYNPQLELLLCNRIEWWLAKPRVATQAQKADLIDQNHDWYSRKQNLHATAEYPHSNQVASLEAIAPKGSSECQNHPRSGQWSTPIHRTDTEARNLCSPHQKNLSRAFQDPKYASCGQKNRYLMIPEFFDQNHSHPRRTASKPTTRSHPHLGAVYDSVV